MAQGVYGFCLLGDVVEGPCRSNGSDPRQELQDAEP
jgi:hypothetical protein